MPDLSQLLDELLAIPSIEDRIKVVAIDLQERTDKYRDMDPFDLADALGVPTPEDRGDWDNYFTSEILSVEEEDQMGGPPSETVRPLLDFVTGKRAEEIEAEAAKLDVLVNPTFDFLTTQERTILEKELADARLESKSENGIGGIMRYCLMSGEITLIFEGDVEDDGACIILRSPYDYRDGRCVDMDKCVYTSW